MNADSVISKILARIDDGADIDALSEPSVAASDARLLSEAQAAFGSWPRALAGTLVHLRTFYERINQSAGADDDDAGSTVDDPRPERVLDAFPPRTLARLRALKERYDPDNVFRDNFNVTDAVRALEAAGLTPAGAAIAR